MFKINKTSIVLLLSLIIFCVLQIIINRYTQEIKTEEPQEIMEQQETIQTQEKVEIQKQEENKSKKAIKNNEEETEWQIEIPKISLIAKIAEGTTKETLSQYVGHFENTKKEEGNIGLAAHNRGYEVNYFQNLKLLKEGDEIRYTHNEFKKIYEVKKCRIIKDTEWEYLENTEDNMLTLITCVENEPEYRRCIQAIEKEEETY